MSNEDFETQMDRVASSEKYSPEATKQLQQLFQKHYKRVRTTCTAQLACLHYPCPQWCHLKDRRSLMTHMQFLQMPAGSRLQLTCSFC